MDPNVYLKYNRLQNELSRKFCSELVTDSDWSDTRLEVVMDIGCGPGNTSTYWMDHYFPDIEKLIGVDNDSGMIGLAKENNKKEKIEFYVADIMDRESFKEWESRIPRIISTFVFHRVSDQKQAFKNVFDLLASPGIASVAHVVKGPFYLAFTDLLQTPKWKPILEATNFSCPESMIKGYDMEHYKQMFEDIGFNVLSCEMRTVDFAYKSDEECKNLLLSLHNVGNMTDKLKEEYKEDIFERFVKHSPRDSEGRPTHNAIALYVKLVKDDKKGKQ